MKLKMFDVEEMNIEEMKNQNGGLGYWMCAGILLGASAISFIISGVITASVFRLTYKELFHPFLTKQKNREL
ncbi:MAG: hypothetical protein E6Q66_03110 [Pedobacter sp.]|nr:MAG: hypothetical protein E6Q66_03110 [Pedobacter sp.]